MRKKFEEKRRIGMAKIRNIEHLEKRGWIKEEIDNTRKKDTAFAKVKSGYCGTCGKRRRMRRKKNLKNRLI